MEVEETIGIAMLLGRLVLNSVGVRQENDSPMLKSTSAEYQDAFLWTKDSE